MSRRYLSTTEAEFALQRGKTVEVFLGGFLAHGQKCIRWASFNNRGAEVEGQLWESIDQGSEDYVDIYTFESLSSEYDEPVRVEVAENIELAASKLGIEEFKFVNQGVVQDEYISYLRAGT
ncbi:hypothetical protein N9H48_08395 [Pseudoalteromonas marina]|uniref:hypothetical protein n=1 Tax=Pseudoalteromonas sp. H71 TaxID=1348395 RepID=UPI0007318E19|nr:hypothetical protein [Pseudoalteromonas sp. H71]KTD96453.1 hypothetical protein ATS71_16095 [Pseudoalteromonas sp. H71]MDA8940408.1 hypothetical protein [Pseudoalteromonas marina]